MALEQHPRLARIAGLKAKLAARKGQSAYRNNVEDLRQQITNLERAHEIEMRGQSFDL